jgi:hypothetical protein
MSEPSAEVAPSIRGVLRAMARTVVLMPQVLVHAVLHPLSPSYVLGWRVYRKPPGRCHRDR